MYIKESLQVQGIRKNARLYRIYSVVVFLLFLVFLYNLIKLHEQPLSNSSINRNIFKTRTRLLESEGKLKGKTRNVKRSLLFVAVLSHWKRWRRRESIRETWMRECQDNDQVKCLFFTDFAGTVGEKERQALRDEIKRNNNDTILTPITERLAFTARLLWIMQWTTSRYNFHYFLRIDDDHFLCLQRLLYELSTGTRPHQALYWGFVHCQPNIVRVDEAWLLLTRDLVIEVVQKANSTLLCHPYADQAVALWVNNSTYNVTYFMDNKRVIHKTAGHDPSFYISNVCEKYLSLHGVFHNEMRKLWLLWHKLYREKSVNKPRYEIPTIEPFEKLCHHSKVFSTDGFYPEYRFKPRLCRLKPTWSITHRDHVAREDAGEKYSSY